MNYQKAYERYSKVWIKKGFWKYRRYWKFYITDWFLNRDLIYMGGFLARFRKRAADFGGIDRKASYPGYYVLTMNQYRAYRSWAIWYNIVCEGKNYPPKEHLFRMNLSNKNIKRVAK